MNGVTAMVDVMQSAQLVSLLIVALAALLVPLRFALAPRLPVPILVGAMAVGILIGRSGCHRVHVGSWLQFLDLFGLAYLLFLAGTGFDFRLTRVLLALPCS